MSVALEAKSYRLVEVHSDIVSPSEADTPKNHASSVLPLAENLTGIQHFGITVSNLERAYEFYTEVLGGTEIMRDGDVQGDTIHDTLMQVDELEAVRAQADPRSVGIPDLRAGGARLDVVFIQFENVVIELLQYRDEEQRAWTEGTFVPPHLHKSPAFPTNMHVSFEVREDADFDDFIATLELAAKQARHGQCKVQSQCDRFV